jgi:hypothetical protein
VVYRIIAIVGRVAQYDIIGKRWCPWNEEYFLHQEKQPPVNSGSQPYSPGVSTSPFAGQRFR